MWLLILSTGVASRAPVKSRYTHRWGEGSVKAKLEAILIMIVPKVPRTEERAKGKSVVKKAEK